MTIQAPVCETDGSYRREQRAGGLTWCVDARGRPLHHTLTRGHVHCGSNGEWAGVLIYEFSKKTKKGNWIIGNTTTLLIIKIGCVGWVNKDLKKKHLVSSFLLLTSLLFWQETLAPPHTGQILEQVSVGFVCPRGVRGQVCRGECLRASCPAHPDAVCVADPCNECRVNFYRWAAVCYFCTVWNYLILTLISTHSRYHENSYSN